MDARETPAPNPVGVTSGAADPIALWVVPVADLGGVARHVLDVTTSGVPGWRVVVLCPAGPLADALRAAGRPVIAEPFGPDAGLRASLSTLRHAQLALRPRVVHSHLSYADVVAAIAKPTRGAAALVSTEHGIARDDAVYHGSRARARAKAALHAARMPRFDALIAVSGATRDAMIAKWHPRPPVRVIHNGIDRPAHLHRREHGPANGSAIAVSSISRLAPEKRIDDLLDAFALLRARHPGATLDIAGSGPLEQALRRRVEVEGWAASVRFHGHIAPQPLLARTDVLAQLSVWENLSYSLLDALVAGVGVVAAPVGGNLELLPPQCLVDPADPAGVASALESQARDIDARPSLPDGWPTVAEMAAEIGAVYESVAA